MENFRPISTYENQNAGAEVELLSEDPRLRTLAQALGSRTFRKTARLSQMLEFICRAAIEGRAHEINEQQIGTQVFSRSEAYSPAEDNIVRVQARLLRQRLEELYRGEAADSEWIILVPKGAYVPVFVLREPVDSQTHELSLPTVPSVQENQVSDIPPPQAAIPGADQARRRHRLFWGALLLVAIFLGIAVAWTIWEHNSGDISFWKSFFVDNRPVLIVPSDDGLGLFEEMQRQTVSLDDYLSGSYFHLQQPAVPNPQFPVQSADWSSWHQYTSAVDLNLAIRFAHLPEASGAQIESRFARVLRLDDLKSHNVIIIGGRAANPWVSLFSDSLKFDVDCDWSKDISYVLDRSPAPGKPARYLERKENGRQVSYGVLAYIPGLGDGGKILLFEGTDMAGTEATADFLLNRDRFRGFLRSLGTTPEGAVPFFEVLLETRSIDGSAPESMILAVNRIQTSAR